MTLKGRIEIRIDENAEEKLKRLAKRQRIKLSQLGRLALADYLEKWEYLLDEENERE